MTVVALLEANPKPSDDQIKTTMDGVLCRCGTYPRIKKAIYKLTKETDL
jgi:isoquinoline 1-oxidoreductase alpha subunit